MSLVRWLKRPIPLWLMLIAVLSTASIVSSAVILPKILGPQPDFSVQSSPPSKVILAGPGNGGSVNVTFTAVNSFSGVLSASVKTPTGVTASLAGTPDNFPLARAQTFLLNIVASTPGNFVVIVTGSSGSLAHSSTVTVVAQAVSLTFQPSDLTLSPGSKGNETIGIGSLNGISGNLTITATVPGTFNPNTVSATSLPVSVHLNPGASVSSTVAVNVGLDQPCGYQCLYAQNTNIQISVGVQGLAGTFYGSFRIMINESLTLTSAAFPSNTDANLTLRNTGPSTVTLFNYTVTNQVGGQYVNPYELQSLAAGIAPSASSSVSILIGSSCSQCGLRGTPYTFVIDQNYVIAIESARGNTFSFTVTR